MRFNRFIVLLSVVLLLATVASGCTSQPTVISHGGPVRDYVSLVDNLRAKGAIVEPGEEFSDELFSVPGRNISVDGENVSVYGYADAGSTDAEAANISPDGGTITRGDMIGYVDWVAAPHFYKTERLIVLYVGENAGVKNLLTELLGRQFAGR